MDTKQTLIALALLAAGVVVFGFLASRSQPAALAPVVQDVAASSLSEESQYMSITVNYPSAPQNIRTEIEQKMGERVAEFKANANIEGLTPEDIAIQGLGGDRRYTLDAEYKEYAAPGYRSYAYTLYEDTLGAHPNSYFITFVFDTESTVVTLPALLAPDPNRTKILAISQEAQRQVTAQLIERLGVPADEASNSYFGEGLSADEENFKSFVIDGDDVVFLIPPYQAAAYAAGSFEIRIPLASLR